VRRGERDLLSILIPVFVGRHKLDEIVHAQVPHAILCLHAAHTQPSPRTFARVFVRWLFKYLGQVYSNFEEDREMMAINALSSATQLKAI